MKKISIQDLYNKLDELNKEKETKIESYKVKQPQLEKIEYDAPTDDELKELAEKTIKEKYNFKRQAETDTANKQIEAFKKLMEEEKLKEQESLKANDEKYKHAEEKLDNELLKRGVQRSSIALGEIANLQANKIDDSNAITAASKKAVADIDEKIATLTKNLEESVKNLNLEEINALSKELYDLKEERRKNQENAIKYNNEVEKDAYDIATSKNQIALNEKIKQTETDYDKQKINEVMKYYYYGFDTPKEAYEAFKNDEKMRDYLGDYYDYVYNYLRSR
ncbi:MAG: hypothetical protein ACI4M6_01200 [Christensenellaceae bacterium]